ncbi:TPR repeat protein [Calothrix sp. NIES-4101]|nr:TPR repeat protein [Calothrix sp. NIES-4101]
MKYRFLLILLLGSYLIFGFVFPSLANSGQLFPAQVIHLQTQKPRYEYLTPNQIAQNPITPNQTDEGKELYEAGRFSEAAQILEQAVQQYRQKGEILKQAGTLGNLSLTYQQMGKWTEAKQAITESLQLQGVGVEAHTSTNAPITNQKLLAQTYTIQGKLFLSIGQTENALQSWQQAEKIFIEAGETSSSIAARIAQTQALQILGYYRSAVKILQEVNATLKTQPDSIQKVVSLRSLGDAEQIVGNYQQSQTALQESLEIAQRLRNPLEISISLLSLGNNARTSDRPIAALKYYQQSWEISPAALIKSQAILNQFSLLVDRQKYTEAQAIIPEIQTLLKQLPPSRSSIYAQINFAESLVKMGRGEAKKISTVAPILVTAIRQAQTIGDTLAEAYGLGGLGKLYESAGQLGAAQELTEKAIVISQGINTPEITYQLQWQLGRLLKAQGNIKSAIASYDVAVNALQNLRSDLVTVDQNVQFSFREAVEPIYRESVALQLQDPTLINLNKQAKAKILDQVRQRIEALQLAELDNFFREACLQGQKVLLDQVVDRDHPTSAILYPIILPDALQIIVKLPQQELKLYTTKVTESEVEQTVAQLRRDLIDPSALRDVKRRSQQVYNWLLKPVAADLAKTQVNTLVFVPDGVLRNLPMSALFDGEKYLVEKYAVSLSPGLQLFDPEPIVKRQLNALTAGLTNPPPQFQKFSPLPAIEQEFKLIAEAGIPTTTLINQKFTRTALETKVKDAPFNVVHLATHGQFSSQANDTFILAADGPINVRQFDHLLRDRDDSRPEALQLLVLSACQTATGDKRAALGLAGIAIRAGARSTIASLWQIDDESTAIFVGSFYRELKKENVSKAEALRRAQLELLKNRNYSSPGYWSAYVLIGNWL